MNGTRIRAFTYDGSGEWGVVYMAAVPHRYVGRRLMWRLICDELTFPLDNHTSELYIKWRVERVHANTLAR